MAKLLQLSRPSKRVSNAVRTWWAMRSQKRRRERNAAVPLVIPAPVLTSVQVMWDATTPNWADVLVGFSFDDPGLPEGEFEIYIAPGPGGTAFGFAGTIASTERSFRQNEVFNDQNGVTYEIRYRSGDLIGPLSNAVDANVST